MKKQEYKFNEEKLLQLFCANKSDKVAYDWMRRPYRVGPYIVATNERILIRVSEFLAKGDYPEEPFNRLPDSPNQTMYIPIGRKDIEAALDNIKYLPLEIKKDTLIDIKGWYFNPYYIRKILAAMKIIGAEVIDLLALPATRSNSPARFCIDYDIEILLNPLSSSPYREVKYTVSMLKKNDNDESEHSSKE